MRSRKDEIKAEDSEHRRCLDDSELTKLKKHLTQPKYVPSYIIQTDAYDF